MRTLLTLGQPHRNPALQAHLRSRRSLALLVALVLCLSASILSSNEAWAKEQPASKEQPKGEGPPIGKGEQVYEPTPTPPTTTPPVSTPPPIETPPTGTLPPPPSEPAPTEPAPTEPAPSKAEREPAPHPQPTPVQRTVTIPTTDGESVGPSDEPGWASWRSEPTPAESGSTTEPVSTTTPSETGPVPASATPTTDRGSPETGIPAAAEEVPAPAPAVGTPATVPASISAPSSEGPVPMIPVLPALQQVVQEAGSLRGAAPQGQTQPVFYSPSPIAPAAGAAVQPLARAVTNLVGTSTSAAAKAVTGVLGTVGRWVYEAASSGEESSSSSGSTTPEPFAPVSPEPLGNGFVSLFSGGGQSSAGGAGATTLLLGVLILASTLLLRRDFRTYLISCELPKPSSALLSPLERPG